MPMISFELESHLSKRYPTIGGVDEAGRGALAGPVFAAIVILDPEHIHPDINDSKKLTPARRVILAHYIRENAIAYAVGKSSPRDIERLNILNATKLSIRRAYAKLACKPQCLLIDGKYLENGKHWRRYPPRLYKPPSRECSLIRGDSRSFSIAAASILAKVARDRYMVRYQHRQGNPQSYYNFHIHKGYGVPSHLRAITKYGLSPIHRRTFLPCKNVVAHVVHVAH